MSDTGRATIAATLPERILDGEQKLSDIREVWAPEDPNWLKWLGLLREYEHRVRRGEEA